MSALPDQITITWNIHDVHAAVESLTDDQAQWLSYCPSMLSGLILTSWSVPTR